METENTILKITFDENLGDNSLNLIKKVLKESLGFNVEIEEIN